ncbi:hypothetical protein SeLEV6574_g07307, partial [Synchytrium endobioticum]
MQKSDALPFTFEDAISKADETRHPALQHFIGDCFFYGNNELNVTKLNKDLAFKYYKESSRQKHLGAIKALANCYWTGEGTRCNPLKAIRLLTQIVDTSNELESIKRLASWHWQLDDIPSSIINGSNIRSSKSTASDEDQDDSDSDDGDDEEGEDEEYADSIITIYKASLSSSPLNRKYGPIAGLKLLLRAAKMGDIQSTHRAATILLHGYNNIIQPNPRKAEELLEYAAVVLGDSDATIALAKYHYNQVLDASSPIIKKEIRPSKAPPTNAAITGSSNAPSAKKLGLQRSPVRRSNLKIRPPKSSHTNTNQQLSTTDHQQQEPSLERSLSTSSQSTQSSTEERLAQSQLLTLTPLTSAHVTDIQLLYITALDKAKEYLEKAASVGDSSSLVLLGDLHRDCKVPIKDEEGMHVNPKIKALEYYILASEKQNVTGMMSAAQMLCVGDGVDVDLRRAFQFLLKASKISSTPRLKDLADFLSAHPLPPIKPLPPPLSDTTFLDDTAEDEELTPYNLYLSSLDTE